MGHLGARHAQIYAGLRGAQLTGVCDINADRAREIAGPLRCEALTDHRRLLGRVDAVSLATPTSVHAPIALDLLRAGVHVLVEKPIAATLIQADAMIRAAARAGVVLQVGHVERFNAALEAARKHLTHPRFIEVHRISPYPFRGTDVSVVLDLMIHDLDLVLMLVRSPLVRVEAVGVPVLSRSEDIANARMRFASGCIADLTASRISDESVRRFRVFQEDSYLSIDSKTQTVELARKAGGRVKRVNLPVNQRQPLQEELAAFVRSVTTGQAPAVSGRDGRAALALALHLEQAMRKARRTWRRR